MLVEAKKIKLLSEQTINQIAAGEVIENPASVVKELIENSLDAKASKIAIEVKAGGFNLIKVSDNGFGMSQDDALLSFERHATSKISLVKDLDDLISMGFRGEALPSIASISKFLMITYDGNERRGGTKIVSEAGRILQVETASRQVGTTIEVRSLFYSTPARKKFQKSPPQALIEIQRKVSLIALSRWDVEFVFISDDKILFELKKETPAERVLSVLGKEIADSLKHFSFEEGGIKIEGFWGLPHLLRSNKSSQYLFLNQRAVVSKEVSLAVSEGYSTMLPFGKFPVFILFISMPGDYFDVNVHPQKKEVRFKDARFLQHIIMKATSKALCHKEQKEKEMKLFPSETFSIQELFIKNQPAKQRSIQEGFSVLESEKKPIQSDLLKTAIEPSIKLDAIKILGIFKGSLICDAASCQGILFPPYIEKESKGLFFIDLSAISLRLFYEKFSKEYEEKELELQTLLFPLKLTFSKLDALLINEHLELICSIGISIRSFGESTYLIDAIDKEFDEGSIRSYLESILDTLKEKELSKKEKKEKTLISACRFISSSGKSFFDIYEAKLLLTLVLKTQIPYYSPLGKKTIGYLAFEDYEKLFN